MRKRPSKDYYSLVLISPISRKSVSIRFPKWVLPVTALTTIGFIGLVIYSFYHLTHTKLQLVEYTQLKTLTTAQQNELDEFRFQIDDLKHDIEDLMDKEDSIRYILDKSQLRYPTNKKKTVAARTFSREFSDLTKEATHAQDLLLKQIALLQDKKAALDTSFRDYYDRILTYQERFDSIPSIQPLYGYIRSGFGWRVHPIYQSHKLHNGIDIPSWIGAPIKAAADGVVEYSGWSGGFGFVVILSHGYGYQTVYAHASQLLVDKGDVVKKGEVIAQVGQTGLSTGPHLHYEVRRWRKPINPKEYLSLDMFTASHRVW